MGLRPVSSNTRGRSRRTPSEDKKASAVRLNAADHGGDGVAQTKMDAFGFGDKDGGFSWMGNLSRALARAGASKDAEDDVGREEDWRVSRFVLLLLQNNFPFVSHVRGDMAACLQELGAQVATSSMRVKSDTFILWRVWTGKEPASSICCA